MNENAELLNFVYQNSQMGVDTINQLKDIVNDENFKKHLSAQLEEYNKIHCEARKALNENGYDEKGLSTLEKIRTYWMINFQTLADDSNSHIAEMLMVGSNMGIINAIKNLKKYQTVEPESRRLMQALLKIEEDNVQQLKEFF